MATDTPSQPAEAPLAPPPSSTATPDAPPSPPLPQKPVPAAPGPRASRLQEVFADRLKHTLAKLSYPNIAACYPTIAAQHPPTLRSIQSQMVSIMESRAVRHFEAILEERDVVRKLNELEDLVAQAGQRRAEGDIDGRPAPTP
ncbi:hypothetical protein BR93DRAFT_393556 [Coniochaeta sp. PMI_546]|nr:hypothetical protein BR93DRAFT_393556 [Coniochaeta sp. PMI_546]